MAEDEETRQAAEQILAEAEAAGESVCSICGKTFESPRSLGQHRRLKHREEHDAKEKDKKQPKPQSNIPDVTQELLVQERDLLVKHVSELSMFVAFVLPIFGLTTMARAEVIGRVAIDYAARDRRVLAGVIAFNRFMGTQEAVELLMQEAAALAVDLRLVDPHIAIEVGPFRGEKAIKPIEQMIGDVIADYEDRQAEVQAAMQQQAQAPQNGSPAETPTPARGRRGAKPQVVEGGVTAT